MSRPNSRNAPRKRAEFAVGDQQFGGAVIEDERDPTRVEPELSGFSTAPAIGTVIMRIEQSRHVRAITATMSPAAMPHRRNASAKHRQRSSNWRQVKRRAPSMTASLSG
jgi:hypothetical protein